MNELRIDVWSDIACPWCYIGKRRLEGALARFPQRQSVSTTWRAFELDPSAPPARDGGPRPAASYAERLARKYGVSPAEGQAKIDRITEIARADGLDFRFDRIRPGNTFDAHRVLFVASRRGLAGAMKERLFRAYLTEGEALGEPETLVRLGADVGLDPEELRAALAGDDGAREVRADEEEARALGIGGVPFFVFARRYAVSGAQPVEVLLGAMTQAWDEAQSRPTVVAEGAACDAEGCDGHAAR